MKLLQGKKFGIKWNLLPPTGYGGMVYYILPVITLGTRSLAMIARNTRIFMLEIIKQDYMRTAKSKGLSEAIKKEINITPVNIETPVIKNVI